MSQETWPGEPHHAARLNSEARAQELLYLAALLLLATGIAHSYLGERYILIRLFRRDDLPKLFGGTAFTTGTLRFAWHLTTVAWWGFAYMLVAIAGPGLDSDHVLKAIAVLALVSGLFALVFTRGRHLSWMVFFVVAALALLSLR